MNYVSLSKNPKTWKDVWKRVRKRPLSSTHRSFSSTERVWYGSAQDRFWVLYVSDMRIISLMTLYHAQRTAKVSVANQWWTCMEFQSVIYSTSLPSTEERKSDTQFSEANYPQWRLISDRFLRPAKNAGVRSLTRSFLWHDIATSHNDSSDNELMWHYSRPFGRVALINGRKLTRTIIMGDQTSSTYDKVCTMK